MGQYWWIMCLDNEQSTGMYGRLYFALSEAPKYLEYWMRQRPVSARQLPASRPTAALELLPSHIKYRICGYLGAADLDGLVCAILSVPHLAAVGQDALNRRLSWAGKRMICVGDYAYELMPNLTAADKKRWCTPAEYVGANSGRLEFNANGFADPKELSRPTSYPRAQKYVADRQSGTGGGVELPTIERLVNPRLPPLKDPVLRNLTRKQYYRGEGVGGNKCRLALSQVAIIQMSWTSDVSAHRGLLHRDDAHGRWVNDRMDIVSAEKLGADWVDTTDTIAEELSQYDW
ncbi:hypothetical protein H4R21_002797 [Coemansia helicoidea]|uniref:Uncharacterized protein n=1 Tax=Coemansia helicoidea TaxID=1286919 RepID=A0ACC1L5V4_9FUNG|nr:hypothetical protein H4R21_002797 [Coemansia helicoidea]